MWYPICCLQQCRNKDPKTPGGHAGEKGRDAGLQSEAFCSPTLAKARAGAGAGRNQSKEMEWIIWEHSEWKQGLNPPIRRTKEEGRKGLWDELSLSPEQCMSSTVLGWEQGTSDTMCEETMLLMKVVNRTSWEYFYVLGCRGCCMSQMYQVIKTLQDTFVKYHLQMSSSWRPDSPESL